MHNQHHTPQVWRRYAAACLATFILPALFPQVAVAQQPAQGPTPERPVQGHFLDAVPEGYQLHAYDD